MSGQDGAGVNGGPAAVAPYVGDTVYLAPLGAGVDATAYVNSTIAFWAYKRRVCLLPGTWTFATQGGGARGGIALKSGTTLDLCNGTILQSTMTKGTFVAFLIQAFPTLDNGPALTTAIPTVGTPTLLSDTSFPVDTWIWVGQTPGPTTFIAFQYRVLAVAGVGPFTLTLDRPILGPFPVGTRIQIITEQMRDIQVNGNGAILEGEADRQIQILGGYRCHINGPLTGRRRVGITQPDYMLAFDLASFECSATDLSAQETIAGFIYESDERVTLTRCNSIQVSTAGVRIRNSVNCSLYDSSASGYTGSGLDIRASNAADAFGCINIRVYGGQYNGTSNAGSTGVALAEAQDCRLMDVVSTNHEFNFQTSASSVRPTFIGCLSERAITVGYLVIAPYSRHVSCTSRADARGYRLDIGIVQATFEACEAWDYTVVGIRGDAGTGVFTWTQGLLLSAVNGVNCTDFAGPDNITCTDSFFSGAAGAPVIAFFRAGAQVATFRGCEFRQTSAGTAGITAAAGNTIRLEGRNDFTGVTTPVTIPGTAYVNRFFTQLNGAAAVVIAWPDLKVGEHPLLTRTVVAGGTGLAPVVVVTVGTGWTYAAGGPAADTDTYHVEVSP